MAAPKEFSLHTTRPWPIRLFNQIGPKLDLNPEKLLHSAQKRTKINQEDQELNRDAFELLLNSIEKTGKINKFGRFIYKERLKSILDGRLRLQHYLQKHPEILEEKIEAPIIILGLQRSGTTFLHRLLSRHPDHRALLSWEALNPIPDPFSKKDGRMKLAKIGQKMVKYMAPHFFAIHPIEYTEPEEEVLLSEMTFLSQVPEATFEIPSYAAWTEAQDHEPAYRYVRKILQFLQWHEGSQTPRTWILKTPQHLEFLEIVHKVFPDALFVMTHRDPQKVIPSFASMIYHNRKIFSDQVDPLDCGAHWLRKNAYAMDKTLAYRQAHPELNILDVEYKELVKNPVSVLKTILEATGKSLSASQTETVNQFLQQNRQHKHGKHVYHAADFGLTHEKIENAFQAYRQAFKLPFE
ncbi:MAG: sulfotransferase [Bacteroidia bacterium]|nr:sulfotransferase [Bacteroidia bacterium]